MKIFNGVEKIMNISDVVVFNYETDVEFYQEMEEMGYFVSYLGKNGRKNLFELEKFDGCCQIVWVEFDNEIYEA